MSMTRTLNFSIRKSLSRAGVFVLPFRNFLFDNPYFLRRIRSFMRGKRFHTLLFVCTLLISAVFVLFGMENQLFDTNQRSYRADLLQERGHDLFLTLTVLLCFPVCLIAMFMPMLLLIQDKEKQAWEMLKLTTLPANRLVVGELLSSFGLVFVLLLISLPVCGLVFLIGGVSPTEVASAYLALLLTALLLSSLSLALCAYQEKFVRAALIGLAVLVALAILSAFLVGMGVLRPYHPLASAQPLFLLIAVFDQPGPMAFYTVKVPAVLMAAGVCLLESLLFVVIASRKVFQHHPSALSGKQFAVAYYLFLILLAASSDAFYFFGFIMISVALSFYVLDQLKEKDYKGLPGKQITADSLPVLWIHALVGTVVLYFWTSGSWPFWPGGYDPMAGAAAGLVILSFVSALWMFAHLVLHLRGDRRNTLAISLGVFLSVLVFPSILGWSVLLNFSSEPSASPLWSYVLVCTNPITALQHLNSQLTTERTGNQLEILKHWGWPPWAVCTAFYASLFGLTALARLGVDRFTEMKSPIIAVPSEKPTGPPD